MKSANLQRITPNPDGTLNTDNTPLAVSSAAAIASKNQAAFLTNGNYVITWTNISDKDGSAYGVYARMFDPTGKTIQVGGSDEFLVNTYTSQSQLSPAITGLTNGGFVITWESYVQDGSGSGIYAQIFDVDGNKLCKTSSIGTTDADKSVTQCYSGTDLAKPADLLVNTYTTDNQYDPAITGLTNGGFVITWYSYGQDGSSSDIHAQIFDADGKKLCKTDSTGITDADKSVTQCYTGTATAKPADLLINTYTTNSQYNPAITGLTNGGFVITWYSYEQDGSGNGIYAQIFDAAGNKLCKTDSTGITDADKNVTQCYTGTATAKPADLQVNTYTTNSQYHPAITGLTNGGFVITWQSFNSYLVYAQIFDASGNKLCKTSSNDKSVTQCYSGIDKAKPADLYVNASNLPDQYSLYGIEALNDGNFIISYNGNNVNGSIKIYNSLGQVLMDQPMLSSLYIVSDSQNKVISYYQGSANLIKADVYQAIFSTCLATEQCMNPAIDYCVKSTNQCADPANIYDSSISGLYTTATEGKYTTNTEKAVSITDTCIMSSPVANDSQLQTDLSTILSNTNVQTTVQTMLATGGALSTSAAIYCVVDHCTTTGYSCADPTINYCVTITQTCQDPYTPPTTEQKVLYYKSTANGDLFIQSTYDCSNEQIGQTNSALTEVADSDFIKYGDIKPIIESKDSEIEELTAEVDALIEENNKLSTENEQYNSEVSKKDSQIEELYAEKGELSKQNSQCNLTNTELSSEITELNEMVASFSIKSFNCTAEKTATDMYWREHELQEYKFCVDQLKNTTTCIIKSHDKINMHDHWLGFYNETYYGTDDICEKLNSGFENLLQDCEDTLRDCGASSNLDAMLIVGLSSIAMIALWS